MMEGKHAQIHGAICAVFDRDYTCLCCIDHHKQQQRRCQHCCWRGSNGTSSFLRPEPTLFGGQIFGAAAVFVM
jgi:hypothetical protein